MAKKTNTPKLKETGSLTAAAKPVAETLTKPLPKNEAKAKAPANATATRTQVEAAALTKPTASITPADIALRAYFIAEKRQKLGLPGNSTNDWVEAERQLTAEAAHKAKK